MADTSTDRDDNAMLGQNVPPPPAEVKVRTMRTDIDGISKSGGGRPQFKNIPVEGIGFSKSRVGGNTASASPAASESFPWWIIAVMVVVLGVLIWFGYTLFLKK